MDISYLLINVYIILTILSDNRRSYGDANRAPNNDFRFPVHDGVQRTVSITKKTFESYLKKNQMVVVAFMYPQTSDDISKRTWEVHSHMFEMTAQVLQRRDVVLGYVNLLKDPQLAKNEGVKTPGTIHIYKKGIKIVYYGHRSPEVLVSFIIKLDENAVSLIDGKTQKKAFDNLESAKIVAYVDKGSAAHKAIEEAAPYFQPYIPFFTVFDAKVAKHLKIKSPGTLLFFKPYEKKPLSANNLQSGEAVRSFVEANKRQTLRKLALDDIHSTWTSDGDNQLVLSFMKMKTPEGPAFFRVVKAVSRNFVDQKNLTFVWVDPENFPMMVDYWQSSYNLDFNKPTIGVINMYNNNGTWFNTDQLTKTHSENHKVSVVLKWLKDVLSGQGVKDEDKKEASDQAHIKEPAGQDSDTSNTSKEQHVKESVKKKSTLESKNLQPEKADKNTVKNANVEAQEIKDEL